MENELLKLEVADELVRPVIEKQIQAAIVANLGDERKLLEVAVSRALCQKTGRDGKISKYSSDNKYDYLEAITTHAIQEAAKLALDEWLAEHKEKVVKALKKELNKPSRQNSIAKAYADAVEESLNYKFTMNCNVDFRRNNDC